jgi:hypothetical protein
VNGVDYAQLKFDLENSSSLKSLRSPHASLIFSYLYQEFKQRQRITAPYQELVDSLDAVLETINNQQPNAFPRSAKNYLDDWSKEQRLLRIYLDSDDTLLVELTPDAERSMRWLEELRQRPFVGTESRFRIIFSTLNEIVTNSSTDPEERLTYLRRQQEALQREIDEILETGEVRRLNETQIRERYMQTNENAQRLLSDFAAVEQNFRELARRIQEATLHPDLQKGAVIGEVLDADEALENSDEGRSFRAFWQFLLSPTQKDEFTRLLTITQQLPELSEIRQNSILQGLTRRLLAAGYKVVESNQQLAEQLRRMLDEGTIAESQRVRDLCASIKHLAFEHVQHPPDSDRFIILETEPYIQLLMERPLWSPREETQFEPPMNIIDDLAIDISEIGELFNQYYVDEDLLEAHLSKLLDTYESVTLSEVLAAYPSTKGIGEVLTYLRLAAEKPHCYINPEQVEFIEIDLYQNDMGVLLRIPQAIYQRRPIS